jgi:glutamate synthase (NADPH/NADH) large chain/glutamate synthase (ferredoxin)
MNEPTTPVLVSKQRSLYDPSYDHDACGLGFVARIDGSRSHDVLEKGLCILENMGHRGACGSDPCTGDGAGLLIQVPHDFLEEVCAETGLRLPQAGDYAVGMLFLPRDPVRRAACEGMFVRLVADESLPFLGWRDVPVDPSRVGDAARDCMPMIRQCFIGRNGFPPEIFERHLFAARKRTEEAIRRSGLADSDQFYVVSLSPTTIVYKGLLLPRQIPLFYLDLPDPRVTSAIAVVHDRFSTNTFPSWRLAHPYRYLCHNGEINTLRGNVMWMRAREGNLSSDLFGPDLKKLFPILPTGASDSASLDAAIEFLVMGGRSLPHAMMMLVPEAWAGNPHMDIDLRAFYDYHNEIVGPWDGPAALIFTDGRVVGATLDPNGLRPARWTLTRGGLAVLSSETGALPIPPEDIVSQDRLRPGEMILVDTVEGRLIRNDKLKASVASRKPYRQWLATHRINLDDLPPPLSVAQPDHASLRKRQAAFGYTTEELRMVLTPMAVTADEAIGSMGNDTPLAVLSDRPQLLFKYLRQLFSQVTNPPIDAIREQMVFHAEKLQAALRELTQTKPVGEAAILSTCNRTELYC